MAGETYEKRLYKLRDDIEEQLEGAMLDLTNEISEAIGEAYDEYEPRLDMEEEGYFAAIGAREALWLVAKSLDIDPEAIRPGWERGRS
jgi:hypothetical protein